MKYSFRFAHLADIHLGAWRENKLREMNREAFKRVIDEIIREEVDFVLISGDIFHISHPDIKDVHLVTRYFKKMKDKGMRIYVVPGSHDYSVDEQTFLSVLEAAGLCINTVKASIEENKLVLLPTEDEETGVVIYGMMGRRNGLEVEHYKDIKGLKGWEEYKHRYKIFQMHSGIEERLPEHLKDIKALPSHLVPKGFDYYASGHIHHPQKFDFNSGVMVFPGPTFSSSFSELNMLRKGSYVIVDVYKDDIGWRSKIEFRDVIIREVEAVEIDVNGLSFREAQDKIENEIEKREVDGKIVMLTVKGELVSGGVSDIDFRGIKDKLFGRGAWVVKLSTTNLYSKEFEEIKEEVQDKSIEEIEKNIINKSINQLDVFFDEKKLIDILLHNLSEVKNDEESKEKYIERVTESSLSSVMNLFNIEIRAKEEKE